MRARSHSADRLSSCALIAGAGVGGVLISVVALPLAFSSPFPTPKDGRDLIIDNPTFNVGLTPAEGQPDAQTDGRMVMAALEDSSDQPLTFAERWNLRVPQAAIIAAPDEADLEQPAEAPYEKKLNAVRPNEPGVAKPGVAKPGVAKPELAEPALPPRTPAAPEHKARPAAPMKTATTKPTASLVNPVERYLWEVYLRKPVKSDSTGDFTWKDQAAAKRLGMSLRAYVIGGMDPDFREQLYDAGRAMDADGLHWSMLSAFRDDYRQGLAAGFKAHVGNSLHGGSRATGGYGHGRAIDITSAEGESEAIWHWIDTHGVKYGLSRPMPRIDPAHIQARSSYHDLARNLHEARQKLENKLAGKNDANAKTKLVARIDEPTEGRHSQR